jgi:hypothetical protein
VSVNTRCGLGVIHSFFLNIHALNVIFKTGVLVLKNKSIKVPPVFCVMLDILDHQYK